MLTGIEFLLGRIATSLITTLSFTNTRIIADTKSKRYDALCQPIIFVRSHDLLQRSYCKACQNCGRQQIERFT